MKRFRSRPMAVCLQSSSEEVHKADLYRCNNFIELNGFIEHKKARFRLPPSHPVAVQLNLRLQPGKDCALDTLLIIFGSGRSRSLSKTVL